MQSRLAPIRALAATCLLNASVLGQTTPAAEAPATSSPPVRAPLVAEGTILTDVEGEMVRDGRRPLWRFRVLEQSKADAAAGRAPRDFVLLPCQLLAEMESRAESVAPATARFSVSGEVLTYGRDNWLLPQHVAWITDHAQRTETTEEPRDPSEDPATAVGDGRAAANDNATRDQGDSIADIVAQLKQEVGPLRRTVDTGDEVIGPDDDPGASGPQQGQLLFSRRGRLGRGPTGAWMFVLDSDVTGLSDPALILLPSQRLNHLEALAGAGWMGQPMLISGEVFTYRGRHFLRPTSWKVVRERPNLIR
jgi:hypothetical protein